MVKHSTIVDNLKDAIYEGLRSLKLDGDYDTVEASMNRLYPRIGINKWCGDRADSLLDQIPNGHIYMDLTINELKSMDKMESLKKLLLTEDSKEAQHKHLKEDCVHYAMDIVGIDDMVNRECRIYAGMWCPVDGEITIVRFLKSVYANDTNLNSLDSLNSLFSEEFCHYTIAVSRYQVLARAYAIYDYLTN